MEAVSDLAERVGVYERLPPYAAMSLGAGDTELINLVRGYEIERLLNPNLEVDEFRRRIDWLLAPRATQDDA